MAVNRKIGYYIAWVSIIANILLFILKYIAGIQSNSIAILADAWHSLSDTLTSVIVIFGFWMATRPADKEHPFGHGRSETISALIISVILGIVGLNFFYESIVKLIEQKIVNYNNFTLYVLVLSVVLKEVMASVSIIYGKKLNSQSLIADGWHHRSDSLTSALILIGSFFGAALWWFDSVMGIAVSIVLLWISFKMLNRSISTLLGRKPKQEVFDNLHKIIIKINPEVKNVRNIKVHDYGEYQEMTCDIEVPPKMTVEEAHRISDEIEDTVYSEMKMRTVVHIEPAGHNNIMD